jgi:TonB-dependent starch-binding outer membrane protein SusC
MNDGASFNALQRAVEWPTCFNAIGLIRAGRQNELTALERMQCIQGNVLSDWFIQDATFFKLRDITLRLPLDAVMRGTRNASLSLSAANWFAWRKNFPVFDPEMNTNDGFNETVRATTEHIPAPATLTASVRVVF